MESNQLTKHQIYQNHVFYYFTSFIPIIFIYTAVIVFYNKNKYIPYFEEIGFNLPEKRLIEVGFNICAWIMLVTFLITDGGIQIRNKKYMSNLKVDKNSENNFQFKTGRLLTGIFAALSFFSCVAYGSILISNSYKYHYIFCGAFLVSTSLYFSLVNIMFVIVKMNKRKELNKNDKSDIVLIDWIHALIGPIFFVISYLLKNHFISIIDDNISSRISKSLQYIGITLLFLNFVRILFRMPVINMYLVYKKNE